MGNFSITHPNRNHFISGMYTTTIIGNVGTCRLVQAKGKSPVLNISLATNRKVGEKDYTDWTSVKVWGDRAPKISPHISKGIKILVTGRPEARAYKAADGTAKAELIVHANEIEFLSKGKPADAELPLDTAAA